MMASPVQGMGGDEGVGWDYHFASNPSADGDSSATVPLHIATCFTPKSQPAARLVNHRSVVTQPATFKYIVHIFHEYRDRRYWGRNVELLFKGRWSAVDGEVLRFKNRLHVMKGTSILS
jgi:hypothetical protein